MNTQQLLLQILLGGLLGILGQGIRIIVGLKKTNDEAKTKGQTFTQNFEGSRLMISLLIGFCAGGLCIITLSEFDTPTTGPLLKKAVLTVIIAGYAGTDFIEGLIRKQ